MLGGGGGGGGFEGRFGGRLWCTAWAGMSANPDNYLLQHIARAVAARTGEEPQRAHSALMQELCVLIRAHRARAALRRRAEAAET